MADIKFMPHRVKELPVVIFFSDVFAVAKSTFGSDVTIGNYNAGIMNEFDFEPVVDINVVGTQVCIRMETLSALLALCRWNHLTKALICGV